MAAPLDFPLPQRQQQQPRGRGTPINLPYKSASFGGWDGYSNSNNNANNRYAADQAYVGGNYNSDAGGSNRRRSASRSQRTLRRGRRLSRRGESNVDIAGSGDNDVECFSFRHLDWDFDKIDRNRFV